MYKGKLFSMMQFQIGIKIVRLAIKYFLMHVVTVELYVLPYEYQPILKRPALLLLNAKRNAFIVPTK